MSKKILIFGDGINQVSLYQACNELGFNSIVIDPSEDAIGKKYASRYFVVEPNDYKKTKYIADKFNISGIASSQMENPLKLMARLGKNFRIIVKSTFF